MFIRIAITLAATFASVSAANAAEYVVKQGDTLLSIAEETNQTVEQLVIMNAEHDWAMSGLPVGTELTYVSRRDIRDANRWCRQRLRELPQLDPNVAIFADCVADTRRRPRHIRYALNEPSGTHFSSVLAYAAAYRERPRSAQLWSSTLSGLSGGLVSSTAAAIASVHPGHNHPEVHIFKEEEER